MHKISIIHTFFTFVTLFFIVVFVQLEESSYTVTENMLSLTVCVMLVGTLEDPIAVHLESTNITATAGK